MSRKRRRILTLDDAGIEGMKAAGAVAARLLSELGDLVQPGITTKDLDDYAVEFAESRGLIHAPHQYQPEGHSPFPGHICTSVNEVICHGIPSDSDTLRDGDIVSVDVTLVKNGYHGDTCATFFVGEPSKETRSLVEVTAQALRRGISVVSSGATTGDIGHAIQSYVENDTEFGSGLVREFQGHGIGQKFHTAPDIPHFGRRRKGTRIIPGMSFTIEPMLNAGHWKAELLSDGWTAVTHDRSLSAQFEHTIIASKDGYIVTTSPGVDPLEISPGGVVIFG